MPGYKKRYCPFDWAAGYIHNLSTSTDLELPGNGLKATSITGGLTGALSLQMHKVVMNFDLYEQIVRRRSRREDMKGWGKLPATSSRHVNAMRL
jgi:hypothetical protein